MNGNSSSSAMSRIKVVVRKRPLRVSGDTDLVYVRSLNTMTVYEPKEKVDKTPYFEEHHWMFDEVRGPAVCMRRPCDAAEPMSVECATVTVVPSLRLCPGPHACVCAGLFSCRCQCLSPSICPTNHSYLPGPN